MSDEIAALQRVFGDDYVIERRLGRRGMGAVYQTLLELQGHLAMLEGHRAGIRGRTERGRLELIRLRAGIGSSDGVRRALQGA